MKFWLLFTYFVRTATAASWVADLNALDSSSSAYVTLSEFDTAGNYIVGGNYVGSVSVKTTTDARVVTLPAASYNQHFVLKISPTGRILWRAVVMTGAEGLTLSRLAVTESGNIFLAGTAQLSSTPATIAILSSQDTSRYSPVTLSGWGAWVIRLSPVGELEWLLSLPGVRIRSKHSFVVDSKNGYFYVAVTSNTRNTVLTFNSIQDFNKSLSYSVEANYARFILKYTLSGEMVWLTASTGFKTESGSPLIELDKSGNLYRVDRLDSMTNITYFSNLAESNASQNVVFAFTNVPANIVKYSSNGTILWSSFIKPETNQWHSNNEPRSVAVDSSGNLYVTGIQVGGVRLQDSNGVERLNHWTVSNYGSYVYKFDTDGDPKMMKIIDDGFYEVGTSIVVGTDDNWMNVGYYNSRTLRIPSTNSSKDVILTGIQYDVVFSKGYLYGALFSKSGDVIETYRLYPTSGVASISAHVACNAFGNAVISGHYDSADLNFERNSVNWTEPLKQQGLRSSFVWFSENSKPMMQLIDVFYRLPTVAFFVASSGRLNVISTSPQLYPDPLVINNTSGITIACSLIRCVFAINGSYRDSFSFDLLQNSFNVYFESNETSSLNDATFEPFYSGFGQRRTSGSLSHGDYSFSLGPQYGFQSHISLSSVDDPTFILFGFKLTTFDSFTVDLENANPVTFVFEFPLIRVKTGHNTTNLEMNQLDLNGSELDLFTRWSLVIRRNNIEMYVNKTRVYLSNISETANVSSLLISTWNTSISLSNVLLISPPENFEHLLLDAHNPQETSTTTDAVNEPSISVTSEAETVSSPTDDTVVITGSRGFRFLGSFYFYLVIGIGGTMLITPVAAVIVVIKRKSRANLKNALKVDIHGENDAMTMVNSTINGTFGILGTNFSRPTGYSTTTYSTMNTFNSRV